MATKTPEKLIDEATLRRVVDRAKREGRTERVNCGEGLVLVVTEAGRARFLHRFPYKGRYPTRWFKGQFPDDVSLYEARAIRDGDLKVLASGLNPAEDAEQKTLASPTLAEFVLEHFKALVPPAQLKWIDTPERSPWFRMMTIHVGPLAQTRIDAILMNDVVAAAKPYWDGDRAKPEGRKLVFAIQRALKHRHLMVHPNLPYHKWLTLPAVQAQPGMGNERHFNEEHASLDYEDAPAFVAQLRQRPTMSARLTEFVILTGVRAKEAVLARWGEIDWKLRVWVIPPERLKTEQKKGKAGKPFVVPLSLAMVRVLRRAGAGLACGPDDFIFPSFHHGSIHPDRPFSMAMPLREVTLIEPVTLHGFRATLTGWGLSEQHRKREPFSLELMDRVLGHMIGHAKDDDEKVKRPKLSAALARYARGGLADPFIARRRVVMREWSRYLAGTPTPLQPVRDALPQAVPHLRLAA